MAQLINEAKRFQKLAGILKESPNMNMSNIALDYSNTKPNTPPGATAGETPNKLNEFKYKNNILNNVNGHGRIDFYKILTDDEVEKFAEKMGYSVDKIYLSRDGRENTADGQYYEYTTIIDPFAPNAGGKTSEELKKIASELNLKESLNIDSVVNEALRKFRKNK